MAQSYVDPQNNKQHCSKTKQVLLMVLVLNLFPWVANSKDIPQIFKTPTCGVGCIECKDKICTRCQDDFHLNSFYGRCTEIKSSIRDIETESDRNCTNHFCEKSSFLQETKRVKCDEGNCETCENDICLTCKQGYKLYKGECVKACDEGKSINPNCFSCVGDDNQCKVCNEGYSLILRYVTKRRECIQCEDPYCAYCSSVKNTQFCIKCKTGFTINNYNKCDCPSKHLLLFDLCISYEYLCLLYALFFLLLAIIICRRPDTSLMDGNQVRVVREETSDSEDENDEEDDDEFKKDCVFGDINNALWKLNCACLICNGCSSKILNQLSEGIEVFCPGCKTKVENFKLIEGDDSTNQTIQIIDVVQNEGLSLNNVDTQPTSNDDKLCSICLILPKTQLINCGSNVPHLLCSYCYNRLISIKDEKNCPFCRSVC